MTKATPKHDIRAWLSKVVTNPALVELLTRERDPERTWRGEMARRWGMYSEQDLDAKTITLREQMAREGKLLKALCKESAARQRMIREGLDQFIGKEQATSSQGGTDRARTKAYQRITALEAQVAKLTEERDAARKAYLDLLDQQAKRTAQ